MKKIALITGSAGQDGSYLAKFLLEKGYKVIAADRRSSRSDDWRHKFLDIQDRITYEDFDLSDIDSIFRIINKYKIDEIYNLAAQSFVKSSFQTPISTANVTGLGVLRFLEVIRNSAKKIKFYQASSSEMIGNTKSLLQNENAIFNPKSPYAVAKIFGHYIVKNYRESYNMYACSGILFNHESPLRGEEFVTRKITKALSEIKMGSKKCLELGNLYAKRDWGYAKDYVEVMWLMLQQKKADDYVIGTGKSHSIKQFINQVCKNLDLKIKWVGKKENERAINILNSKTIIRINKKYYRPSEVNFLKADFNNAKKKLKWLPKTSFKTLVEIMVESEIKMLILKNR